MAVEIPQSKRAKSEFRGSLVRTVVIWLLILTLVPVTIMGIITAVRSEKVLRDQISGQMQVVVDGFINDINDTAAIRNRVFDGLLENEEFNNYFAGLVKAAPGTSDYEFNRSKVMKLVAPAQYSVAGFMFDEIYLVDPTGNIIISTTISRIGEHIETVLGLEGTFGTNAVLGKTKSLISYNPSPIFPSKMVLFTSKVLSDPSNPGAVYTLVGAIASNNLQDILIQASKYFPGSRAFFFRGSEVVGVDASNNAVVITGNQKQITDLQQLVSPTTTKGSKEYISYDDLSVMTYASWDPNTNMALVLEVPSSFVTEQTRYTRPFNIIILIITAIVTTGVVTLGGSRIIAPLAELAKGAETFAAGDLTHRVKVTRNDEIGLLGYSFNLMADEINRMYRSMQSKVEERNQQLLTSAEMAQVATSLTDRQDILKRAVNLLTTRFDYDYACAYLLDNSLSYFTMRESAGRLAGHEDEKVLASRIRTRTLMGWVISNNEARVVTRQDETANLSETLMEEASDEAIIPISAGGQVVGLLDVQSLSRETFGPETITVLKMLANQLANGLQNIQLVESTQVDLKETSLTYQASRQVTQVRDRAEIWPIVKGAIEQTSYFALMLEGHDTQFNTIGTIDRVSKDKGKISPITLTLQHTSTELTQQPYLLFDNLTRPSEFFAILNFFAQRGCATAAIIPVRVNNEVVQLLAIGSKIEKPITVATLQPYLNLVEVMSNTEQRIQVTQTLEKNVQELQSISNVSRAVATETEVQNIYQVLHQQISFLTGGPIDFFVALYDKNTDLIRFPYNVEHGKHNPVEPIPLGKGITSVVLKTAKPLLLAENAAAKTKEMGIEIRGEPAKSWLGIPLIMGGEVIGAMVAEDMEKNNRLSEQELRLFNTLAPQIATAIRNAELLMQMQEALKAFELERFLLNTLLNNIPEVIYFKDGVGRYLRVSQTFSRARGYDSPTSIVGKTDLEILPDNPMIEAIHREEMEIIQSQKVIIGEINQTFDAAGQENWVEISRMAMIDPEGKPTGMLGISHNITDLKRTELLAQQRAQQLQIAAEIARDTSGTLNLGQLLERSVNLVRDRFGFYHASIFLLDVTGQYAILRESTGEAGRQMKSSGHRLAVGSQSLVGQATSRREAVVVDDVTKAENYYANPLLPNTHSELVLPLILGEELVGAIDVQSVDVAAFTPEAINILRILADQLAVAITNADLFAETQENISKHRFLHQIATAAAACTSGDEALSTTVEGLKTAMDCDRVAAYLTNSKGILEIRASVGYQGIDLSQLRVSPGEGTVGVAAVGRNPILVRDSQVSSLSSETDDQGMRSQLALPILYSDRAIGVIHLESAEPGMFTENDQEILGSLGSTLGAILSNTQLVSQVRHQVEQQVKLFEIASKIRRSADIETIMRTSTRELVLALRARKAQIRILEEETSTPTNEHVKGSNGKNGNNGNNGHSGQNADKE